MTINLTGISDGTPKNGPALLLAVCVALLTTGCDKTQVPQASQESGPSKQSVTVTRATEAEDVLKQLGQRAWVFKHFGGEITSELKVLHRPPGKNQSEKELSVCRGDDVVSLLHSKEKKKPDTGGYAIVIIPRAMDPSSGNVIHSFSLDGFSGRQEEKASDLFPESVFSYSGSGWGDSPVPATTELLPGESKTLIDHAIHLSNRKEKPVPPAEQEMIRYVLTVTSLKDGQLPKR